MSFYNLYTTDNKSLNILSDYLLQNNTTLRNKFKSLQNRRVNHCLSEVSEAPLCLFDQTAETEEMSLITITWQEKSHSLYRKQTVIPHITFKRDVSLIQTENVIDFILFLQTWTCTDQSSIYEYSLKPQADA